MNAHSQTAQENSPATRPTDASPASYSVEVTSPSDAADEQAAIQDVLKWLLSLPPARTLQ